MNAPDGVGLEDPDRDVRAINSRDKTIDRPIGADDLTPGPSLAHASRVGSQALMNRGDVALASLETRVELQRLGIDSFGEEEAMSSGHGLALAGSARPVRRMTERDRFIHADVDSKRLIGALPCR
jgi:hypothetical protein